MLAKLLEFFGFKVSKHKMIPPPQHVVFLDMCIDTRKMQYRLPQYKLDKLAPLIHAFMDRNSASKLELQSIAGVLSHCSYVVRGGWVFIRGLINLIRTLPYHR